MSFLQSAGILVTLAIFTAASAIVWRAGSSLSRSADAIAERTGLGKAFVGVIFLGVATSLPELATTASAALENHPTLAGTNLLGGVAMQIAVLALIDGVALRERALTHFSGEPAFLMQGVLLALLLAIAAAGVAVGDRPVFGGVGVWPLVLGAVYAVAVFVMYRYENDPRWEPVGETRPVPATSGGLETAEPGRYADLSTAGLAGRFAMAAAGVFAGGYFVAVTGARLAELSGLGESFVGATLVAFATSLPEVSTTWSAVRLGAYAMAVGNILGTNALELALFLPAEVLYTEGAIFAALDERGVFLAALGIVLTCIYLWGVLERRDRTVLSFGVDSALVLVVYGAGLAILSVLA